MFIRFAGDAAAGKKRMLVTHSEVFPGTFASTTETYGAGRFLYTPLPDHGLTQPGELVLDFNRAQNPPCAYTPYATCPLPPPQNRLPIPILAGQQRYHD